MFGIGGQELILILLIALIVLGPKKLPDIAKTLGKALGEFQRASNDLRKEFDQMSDTPHPSHSPRYPEKTPEQSTTEDASSHDEEDSRETSPEKPHQYNPDEIEGS
ncbi:MAG: twin-arginine translocase TatA/TatE family subunit [Desulfomonilia bacterium]